MLTRAEIIEQGRAVQLTYVGGTIHRFHAVWLRDNAGDAGTRSPGNGQRLITILDIPPETTIAAVEITAPGTLQITFAPEGKSVAYSALWLAENAYDRRHDQRIAWTGTHAVRWDSRLSARVPRASLAQVRADRAALGSWLRAVRTYGFAMLTGVPSDSGALCQVVELFGYVRETNYGRWFDVRAQLDPENLAYTTLGLQAHTDNPYRDPLPTLQLLCCLENTVGGGESFVVDGFTAVARLVADMPDKAPLLWRHCACFEYAGSPGVRLRARRPLIELGPDGELVAVRFNHRSLGVVSEVPFEQMSDYYVAYRRLAKIASDPTLAVRFRLEPGELFIVDNTRVLHGRTAFSGSGSRWLQGCYADRDGLLSTLAVIEEEATSRAPISSMFASDRTRSLL